MEASRAVDQKVERPAWRTRSGRDQMVHGPGI